MSKSTAAVVEKPPKRRGRPEGPKLAKPIILQLYLHQPDLIDAWMARHPDVSSKAKAIRQLIDKGLAAE